MSRTSTLYHSELVKAGEVDVTITCDKPVPSKFPGKPERVSMKFDGEERYYEVENDECGDALCGYKGKTVTILASGRGSDASIEVIGESEPRRDDRRDDRRETRREEPRRREPERRERTERREPERREREPEPRPERRREEPRQMTKEEREELQRKTFKKAAIYGAKCAVVYQQAWKFAEQVLANVQADANTEDVRAIATTLYIEIKGHTDIDAMPTAFIDLKATAPREPEPRREPEPKREDPPPRQEPARPPVDEPDAPEDDIPF